MRVVHDARMPVADFNTMTSEWGEKVQANINEEKKIQQVNELKAGQCRALLKRILVGNKNAADNNQQQNQTIPD